MVVTDGFTGNVALKLMEGTAKTVTGAIRDAARSNPLAALGGLLMRPALGGLRRELDPDTTGGAILLGLRGVAVVGHGSSGAEGIANAVRLAARAVRSTRSSAPRRCCARAAPARRPGRREPRLRRRRDRKSGAMNSEEVLDLVREHLAEELEVDAAEDRRGDPLQGGPRRRLARPLRARDGARGPLWIAVSEEQASKIETVGDAVAFVLEHAPPLELASTLAELIEELPDELREQALTHSSWTEERTDSYERLAYLGDSVLALAVAADLVERFPAIDAGGLTKIHNQAVSGVSCAEVGRELGVPEMLREAQPQAEAGDPGRGPARRRGRCPR